MFYVVRKPDCSLEAACTPSTDLDSLQLVASGEREAQRNQDIWDYTEWRLFADRHPSHEEILSECEQLLTPSVQFVFLYPAPMPKTLRTIRFHNRHNARRRRASSYLSLTKVYGPTKDGRLQLYHDCPLI